MRLSNWLCAACALICLGCAAFCYLWRAGSPPPRVRQLTVKQVSSEQMMKSEGWFTMGSPELPDQEIILDATVDSLSSGRPASFSKACQDPDSNAVLYVFSVRDELHAHVL